MTNIRRVYAKHGAWYFVDHSGKWHRLSSIKDGELVKMQAYVTLVNAKSRIEPLLTRVIDDWVRERLKSLSHETRKEYTRSADIFKEAFAEFRVVDVRTVHVNKFIYENFRHAPNMANKMVDRLSQIFKLAIGQGLRETNPCDAFDRTLYRMKGDSLVLTRYEYDSIRTAALQYPDLASKQSSGQVFVAMIDLATHIWQRSQEIRTLTDFQVHQDNFGGGFIRIKPGKTATSSGQAVDVKITSEISEILERARKIKRDRGIVACSWLFPTLGGTAYTRSGLQQLWNKYKAAAGIQRPVTFRHVRPFGATEAWEQGVPIEEISTRLVHTDLGTTRKYLRSKVAKKSDLDFKLRTLKTNSNRD